VVDFVRGVVYREMQHGGFDDSNTRYNTGRSGRPLFSYVATAVFAAVVASISRAPPLSTSAIAHRLRLAALMGIAADFFGLRN